MAWNTPLTWVAGAALTAAQLNAQVRDNMKAIGDAWGAYAPLWTASTNPAIGNGTIAGRYRQIGQTVDFRVVITMGSTTTYGTGQWSVSLPVASVAAGVQDVIGEAIIGGGFYPVHGRIATGTSSVLLYCDPTTAGGFMRTVSSTTPAAWASGASLVVQGTYEAA